MPAGRLVSEKKRVKYWLLSDGDQIENSSNCWNTETSNVVGNQQGSRATGTFNDYRASEYTSSEVETGSQYRIKKGR